MVTPERDQAQHRDPTGVGSSATSPIDVSIAAALRRGEAPRWRSPAGMLLVLWLAYRVASWRVLGLDATVWNEAAQGVFLDVAVVTGLVLSARVRGVAALGGIAAALRVLDLGSCIAARSHVSPVVWWHVEPAAWRVAVEASVPVLVGVAVGVGWLATRLIMRCGRALGGTRRGHWLTATIAVVLCGQAAIAPRHALHAGGMPEIDVARSWLTFHGWRPPLEYVAPDPATRQRWRRYGWLTTAQPRPHARKISLIADMDPANRATVVVTVPARGAVVVFMESMNAGWSQLYDKVGRLPTPGLRRVAARGTVIAGVLTQARPTHNGIVASLCGVLPGTWPLDSARGLTLPSLPGCLPRAVADAGGAAVFMQGSPLAYSGLDTTLDAMGFTERLGLRALTRAGGPTTAARGPWGLWDRAVYAAARRKLRTLRAAQRPYLLVISTADGHLPGTAAPDCPAQGPPAQRAQACADLALLKFVTDLHADGDEQLILLVTADHAAPDVPAIRAAMPAGAGGAFAPIPVVVAGPGVRSGGYRLRVAGGQLDLPATLANLLGLPALPGVDLLAEQSIGRIRLGTMGRRRVGVANDAGRLEAPLSAVERRCRSGAHLGLPNEPAGLACDVARFLRYLDDAWHRDRLADLRVTGRK